MATEQIDYTEYSTNMRKVFSIQDSIKQDGSINHSYFLAKKGCYWNPENQKALLKGIEVFGIGKWRQINYFEFAEKANEYELQLRTCIILGINDISSYVGQQLTLKEINDEREKNLAKSKEFHQQKYGLLMNSSQSNQDPQTSPDEYTASPQTENSSERRLEMADHINRECYANEQTKIPKNQANETNSNNTNSSSTNNNIKDQSNQENQKQDNSTNEAGKKPQEDQEKGAILQEDMKNFLDLLSQIEVQKPVNPIENNSYDALSQEQDVVDLQNELLLPNSGNNDKIKTNLSVIISLGGSEDSRRSSTQKIAENQMSQYVTSRNDSPTSNFQKPYQHFQMNHNHNKNNNNNNHKTNNSNNNNNNNVQIEDQIFENNQILIGESLKLLEREAKTDQQFFLIFQNIKQFYEGYVFHANLLEEGLNREKTKNHQLVQNNSLLLKGLEISKEQITQLIDQQKILVREYNDMSIQVSNLKMIEKDLLTSLQEARIMNENVRGLLLMQNEESKAKEFINLEAQTNLQKIKVVLNDFQSNFMTVNHTLKNLFEQFYQMCTPNNGEGDNSNKLIEALLIETNKFIERFSENSQLIQENINSQTNPSVNSSKSQFSNIRYSETDSNITHPKSDNLNNYKINYSPLAQFSPNSKVNQSQKSGGEVDAKKSQNMRENDNNNNNNNINSNNNNSNNNSDRELHDDLFFQHRRSNTESSFVFNPQINFSQDNSFQNNSYVDSNFQKQDIKASNNIFQSNSNNNTFINNSINSSHSYSNNKNSSPQIQKQIDFEYTKQSSPPISKVKSSSKNNPSSDNKIQINSNNINNNSYQEINKIQSNYNEGMAKNDEDMMENIYKKNLFDSNNENMWNQKQNNDNMKTNKQTDLDKETIEELYNKFLLKQAKQVN